MAYNYTKKSWSILFVAELEGGQIKQDSNGDPVVRISLSCSPRQSIRYQHLATGKQLLVLLETESSQSKFRSFLNEIEELRVHKEDFLLEPLSVLIKNRAAKEGFAPFKYGKAASIKKSEPKAIIPAEVPFNPLQSLLEGNA